MSLREVFAALPELEPPATLAARVEAGWRSRRRRNRIRVGGGLAVIALLACLPAFYPRPPAGASAGIDIVAVRTLDRELQLAYAAAASEERIAALWLARQALLAGETQPRDPSAQPTPL